MAKLVDLKEEIGSLTKRLHEVTAILECKNKSTPIKFNQMVTRLAQQLAEENRLKHRQLSSGRPRLIDDE